MMRSATCLLIVLLIAGRELFHSLFRTIPLFDIKTNEERMTAVKVIESYTAFYNFIILALLIIVMKSVSNNLHIKWFIGVGIIYSSGLCVISLFPYMPVDLQILFGKYLLNTFAEVFIVILSSLVLYYLICIKKKWIL